MGKRKVRRRATIHTNRLEVKVRRNRLINWLWKMWVQLILFPYHRRQVRNGVTALLLVDERMKANQWPRQRRRQVFRQLVRQPAHFSFIYDLLYQEHNVKGDIHGTQ